MGKYRYLMVTVIVFALILAGCAENASSKSVSNAAVSAKGEKGENGADGKDGIDGKDGVDGKDGIDGKAGVDGKNGIDGKAGADGKNGIDGKDGADGKAGVDGKNGIDGKDGVDGKDGTDGKAGLGFVLYDATQLNSYAEGQIVVDEAGLAYIILNEAGQNKCVAFSQFYEDLKTLQDSIAQVRTTAEEARQDASRANQRLDNQATY